MTQDDIYSELTPILRDVLMQDDLLVRPELTAKDVEGWDSFKMIEIVLAVESHFGIKISSRQLDSVQKVGDLVDAIQGARPARG